MGLASAAATAALAAAACAILIVILRPVLGRYALARPNARSSHREPTPQGGGIAVIAATAAAAAFGLWSFGTAAVAPPTIAVAAFAVMALIGAADDIRPLAVTPRFALQALVVAATLYALPDSLRVASFLPWWIERAALLVGLLWFVNLVNFMDGIDWMTVAETVPIAAALAVIGWLGALASGGVVLALALGGAMIGFGWFNKPVAKLFLGDVGSLPIGLLIGWLLIQLAGNGHLAAALLLPLYYLADATLTLLRRLRRGEAVWQAHRTHFYQRATDRGFTVIAVVGRVLAVNIVLAALALATVMARSRAADAVALAAGAALVGWLLYGFASGNAKAEG